MCDQVVALLSGEHSASLVWGDEDGDTESVDMDDAGDDDRLFTYEVSKRNEQEESAVSRPGFQVMPSSAERKSNSDLSKMNSLHISRDVAPDHCSVDPSTFVPRLFNGDTAQGFWTVTFVHKCIPSRPLDQYAYNAVSLNHLLWVLSIDFGHNAHSILEMKTPSSYQSRSMRKQFRSLSRRGSGIGSQSNIMSGVSRGRILSRGFSENCQIDKIKSCKTSTVKKVL
jgi:hypothetical protein